MEAVKISNLSYKYPSADEYCLKNVSFSVSEGEVCAIVGPNGCGKTTICNIIRGLIPSFHGGEVEGSVEIFGKSTKEISEEEKAKRIGFVFQNPFTQNSGIKETVFEEIAFGLENMGVDREEIITKVMDIISLLQIEAFMFKHPCELSGGQRQRVALASIIVQDPDIIVIDEPTSQLDPKGTEDVFEIIKYLNRQKKTIVLVEHKMNLIAEYADHIVYLNDGSVLLDGSPEDVLSSELLYEKNLDMPYVAVEGVSISADLGEKIAIIGENGAGKTTTAKLMNGLLKPTKGEVLINGVSTKGKTTATIARKVAYVFQNPDDQIFNQEVLAEISYTPRYFKVDEETVNKRLKKAVKLTGLKPYINENPYNLSYSYRKFVTIAAAIAADPDVFVFDEPTACQDRHGIRLLSGIINALSSEGKLVITITHDMEFVAENFDRTVCMADKHILMDDKTNRILTDDSLMEKAALKKPNVSYLASEMGFEGVITSEDFLAALTENSKRL